MDRLFEQRDLNSHVRESAALLVELSSHCEGASSNPARVDSFSVDVGSVRKSTNLTFHVSLRIILK